MSENKETQSSSKKKSMNNKTEQVLAYIVQKVPGVCITSLMKLCYFIDLIATDKRGEQITEFKYKGYAFGPFDSLIYTFVGVLVNQNIIIQESRFSYNEEYICYNYNEKQESLSFESLTTEETEITDRVISQLSGYGAKALSDIAYKTKPMIAIGAKQGEKEHINKPIDLTAK